MKRNTLNSAVLLLLLGMLFACKAKKTIVAVPKTTDSMVSASEAKKSETLQLLRSKDMVFNTLSLKAKANLDINGNANEVTMNIRIQKDKMIWVSITAILGIEVARAMITPDSIKVRNNLQSVYLRKPFSYAYRYTNKQVDFALLQSIFSGNTIGAFMNSNSGLEQEDGTWVLKGQQQDLAYRVLFNTLFKVAEDNLNDVTSGQALKVVYGDYQRVNDSLFPTNLKINSIAGKQRIGMEINFSKVESNLPLDFPFTVPKKFEVIN